MLLVQFSQTQKHRTSSSIDRDPTRSNWNSHTSGFEEHSKEQERDRGMRLVSGGRWREMVTEMESEHPNLLLLAALETHM